MPTAATGFGILVVTATDSTGLRLQALGDAIPSATSRRARDITHRAGSTDPTFTTRWSVSAWRAATILGSQGAAEAHPQEAM
jgi:hypothetical protein